jgi:hypothetical protein
VFGCVPWARFTAQRHYTTLLLLHVTMQQQQQHINTTPHRTQHPTIHPTAKHNTTPRHAGLPRVCMPLTVVFYSNTGVA